MYDKYIKRFFDFTISLISIILLSWLYIILIVVGAIVMKGNPFFVQPRPGKHGKVFNMLKFRTMTNAKDKDGNLLPDDVRLVPYGKFLRSTSLDELPELFCILKGDMSLVGPRPLLVQYLPLYNEEQSHRHDVRPGLTGLAQVNGRSNLGWKERFEYDVYYVRNISFKMDLSIIFKTIAVVLKHEDIENEEQGTWYPFTGNDEDNIEDNIEDN